MKEGEIQLTPEHPRRMRANRQRHCRRGLKPVPPKTSVSLRIDTDVLEWFKAQGPVTKRASMQCCERLGMRPSNSRARSRPRLRIAALTPEEMSAVERSLEALLGMA